MSLFQSQFPRLYQYLPSRVLNRHGRELTNGELDRLLNPTDDDLRRFIARRGLPLDSHDIDTERGRRNAEAAHFLLVEERLLAQIPNAGMPEDYKPGPPGTVYGF